MVSSKDKILDISVNLARVSDWVLSKSLSKQARVDQFLQETKEFLSQLSESVVSEKFHNTLTGFKKEFEHLLKDRHQEDKEEWAERALTWANILQHRAKHA